jgi:hypothetical protein
MHNATQLPSIATMGDTIVGNYDTITGRLIKEGTTLGDQEYMAKTIESMERSLRSSGATKNPKLAIKTGPKKKEKRSKYNKKAPSSRYASDIEPPDFVEEIKAQAAEEEAQFHQSWDEDGDEEVTNLLPAKEKKKIQFSNDFGRITLKVEDVLENKMAFGLIFAEEDDMIFVPKPGETLSFIDPDKNEHSVYFPDVLFTLPDGIKNIMIIFKQTLPEDELTN